MRNKAHFWIAAGSGLFALIVLWSVLWSLPASLLPVHADSRPASIINAWQIKPQALPTTLTNICNMVTAGSAAPPCGRDVYACLGDVNQNPSSTVLTVTIQDIQPVPVNYWNQVPLTGATSAAGSGYKIFDAPQDTGCRWFPGGMQVQASGTGAFIYMSGKY